MTRFALKVKKVRTFEARKVQVEKLIQEICQDKDRMKVLLERFFEAEIYEKDISFEEVAISTRRGTYGARADSVIPDICHITFKTLGPNDITVRFADVMNLKRCGNIKVVLVISTSDTSSTEKDVTKALRLNSKPQIDPDYSFTIDLNGDGLASLPNVDVISTVMGKNSMNIDGARSFMVFSIYGDCGIKTDWNGTRSTLSPSILSSRILYNTRISESCPFDWNGALKILRNTIESSRLNIDTRKNIITSQLTYSKLG